jgi:putative ABC transport system ATP-binding protein
MNAIEARDVHKQITVGGRDGATLSILRGVDLTVAAGESVAILGASGSGKTTLLSLLAGLDLPTRGEIRIDGQALHALDEDARAGLRAGRVGFVFQSFQLLAGFNALENVMLAAELAGDARAADSAREILGQVGLGERLRHAPHQLSGGEQQRVAIARAFASRPKILFADEPTGNLDPHTADLVFSALMQLVKATRVAMLIATHNMDLAARMDRRVSLREGQVVELD